MCAHILLTLAHASMHTHPFVLSLCVLCAAVPDTSENPSTLSNANWFLALAVSSLKHVVVAAGPRGVFQPLVMPSATKQPALSIETLSSCQSDTARQISSLQGAAGLTFPESVGVYRHLMSEPIDQATRIRQHRHNLAPRNQTSVGHL